MCSLCRLESSTLKLHYKLLWTVIDASTQSRLNCNLPAAIKKSRLAFNAHDSAPQPLHAEMTLSRLTPPWLLGTSPSSKPSSLPAAFSTTAHQVLGWFEEQCEPTRLLSPSGCSDSHALLEVLKTSHSSMSWTKCCALLSSSRSKSSQELPPAPAAMAAICCRCP